jgi:hypothetical protein
MVVLRPFAPPGERYLKMFPADSESHDGVNGFQIQERQVDHLIVPLRRLSTMGQSVSYLNNRA